MTKLLSNAEAVTALFVIGMYHAFLDDEQSANASFTFALQMLHAPVKFTSTVNSKN